jgi:hypothetical protein
MSNGITKVSYTHDAMIDLIMQDPTVTTAELAQVFGYSPAWVSRILASDSFQSRLAQRKSALIDPIVARSLNDRLRAVAVRSMDVIEERLAAEPSAQYAIDALELATKGLGVIGAASR